MVQSYRNNWGLFFNIGLTGDESTMFDGGGPLLGFKNTTDQTQASIRSNKVWDKSKHCVPSHQIRVGFGTEMTTWLAVRAVLLSGGEGVLSRPVNTAATFGLI